MQGGRSRALERREPVRSSGRRNLEGQICFRRSGLGWKEDGDQGESFKEPALRVDQKPESKGQRWARGWENVGDSGASRGVAILGAWRSSTEVGRHEDPAGEGGVGQVGDRQEGGAPRSSFGGKRTEDRTPGVGAGRQEWAQARMGAGVGRRGWQV